MKYAIISDIHSNLEALEKAFAIIDDRGADEIVCLGDIVGYGADPNACVDLVRRRCSVVVLGNHDAAALDTSTAHDFNAIARKAALWTADQLQPDHAAFLSSLPLTATREDMLFVHSSPQFPDAWEYIIDSGDAEAAFDYFTEKICFIGHSHVPGIFSLRGRAKNVSRDDRYIVNVGSIGQPRDGNPMLSFGIFNSSTWEYELIRSEYDIQSAVDKIFAAGLPQELGYRLLYGS